MTLKLIALTDARKVTSLSRRCWVSRLVAVFIVCLNITWIRIIFQWKAVKALATLQANMSVHAASRVMRTITDIEACTKSAVDACEGLDANLQPHDTHELCTDFERFWAPMVKVLKPELMGWLHKDSSRRFDSLLANIMNRDASWTVLYKREIVFTSILHASFAARHGATLILKRKLFFFEHLSAKSVWKLGKTLFHVHQLVYCAASIVVFANHNIKTLYRVPPNIGVAIEFIKHGVE